MKSFTQSFLGVPVVAVSRAFRSVLETTQLVATSSASVLVQGESGVGKEIIARALHCYSRRPDGPWVSLNCAALPDSLLEMELFGCEQKGRAGMFELAHGGTLFLDEIGDMDPAAQVKLLRVLDGKTFFRVGGMTPIRVDVRVVTATNQNLDEAVRSGRFRADLFHRLSEFRLAVPPLRERPEDVIPLAELFLRSAANYRCLTEDAKRALESYSWPGNVRELRNVILMCAATARGSEIRTLDLPERLQEHYARDSGEESDLQRLFQTVNTAVESGESVGPTPGAMLQDMERRLIFQVLAHTGGHQERASQLLGISRRTLNRKLKQYAEEGRISMDEAFAELGREAV